MRIKTLALLAILFMGLSFVSCSTDDIDCNGGNNTEIVESLVGTWKLSDDDAISLHNISKTAVTCIQVSS